MKNQFLIEIDKNLRGYDLMVIETGGKYEGQGTLDECLVLADSYIATGGCIDDLHRVVDAIIEEYEEMQKKHKWKYYDNMMGLLHTYRDKLHTKAKIR